MRTGAIRGVCLSLLTGIVGRRAVTLIELMMVVAIAALSMTLVFPAFRKTQETQYLRQTESLLFTIYSGRRHFFLRNNTYTVLTGASTNADWRTIHMDDPDSNEVSFTVAAAGVGTTATFTAMATRLAGRCTIEAKNLRTIDQQRTMGGTWPTYTAL